MSSIYSVLHTDAALLILMIALILLMCQTVVFLLMLREKPGRKQITAAALHMIIGFLLFVVILDGYDTVFFESIPRDSVQTGWFLYRLPWLVYAALGALSAAVLVLRFRDYRRYKTGTVTPDSIRQAVDLLPEGICISAADGTVRLANLKMDTLCRVLTGDRPSDAGRLWAYLQQAGEDQEGKRLIHTPQGEVWLFARDTIAAEAPAGDMTGYERISAVNVTGRYRITEELREKNAHLQEIQRRMKQAADLSSEMFVKQEEAAARSALHNELGQVLLMGRHYIEHPESTDRSMVALMTRQMNRFMLGENGVQEEKLAKDDELQHAVQLAGSIGVQVEFCGDAADVSPLRRILAQAIRECAANTVKHAEGDRIYVEISERGVIAITNNGRPPKGPIAESGGLLALRRSVEAAGGQMIVQSEPGFRLQLRFPEIDR